MTMANNDELCFDLLKTKLVLSDARPSARYANQVANYYCRSTLDAFIKKVIKLG